MYHGYIHYPEVPFDKQAEQAVLELEGDVRISRKRRVAWAAVVGVEEARDDVARARGDLLPAVAQVTRKRHQLAALGDQCFPEAFKVGATPCERSVTTTCTGVVEGDGEAELALVYVQRQVALPGIVLVLHQKRIVDAERRPILRAVQRVVEPRKQREQPVSAHLPKPGQQCGHLVHWNVGGRDSVVPLGSPASLALCVALRLSDRPLTLNPAQHWRHTLVTVRHENLPLESQL
mmetsp:Transcript_23253/g.39353  ORF Transcript_23253/g.39353 Transcript_23253/m.39353 type:complete len:234 (-) Transcript_23253:108-809(-)